jgi:hypothetical protein
VPVGMPADEEKAQKILIAKTPLVCLGSSRRTSRRPWSSSPPIWRAVVTGATYDVTGGDSAHNAC